MNHQKGPMAPNDPCGPNHAHHPDGVAPEFSFVLANRSQ